ncbi:MAG: carboxypeptidase, partial [Proteobacteria bacterium]|nr:carboxypeptidase [Pseudomonadota bacterium]
MARITAPILLLALVAAAPALRAEEVASKSTPPAAALPADATTGHTLRVGDRQLGYSATAGTLPLA